MKLAREQVIIFKVIKLLIVTQELRKSKKFEIINDSWIKDKSLYKGENETFAMKIKDIKCIICTINEGRMGYKDKFSITLTMSGSLKFTFEYEPEERDEYLKDKKFLEDLLFNQE